MAEPWTFEIAEARPDDWPADAVALGGGSPDLFTVARNGAAVRAFTLSYRDPDYRHHTQAIAWQGWFVFGFGGRAILWREQSTIEIDLGCYFEEFLPNDDYLLVISGQGIVRLDPQGRTVWRNDALGLDGVNVFDVEDGLIDGQGEWDPPDGWRDFLISLETGEAVDDIDHANDDE